ncbi:MAG: serine/threonine-protein phosphatase [Deltaproteobacteria bacterium]|jgi:protein phosphatase|nr:serine/threonine-protein phosphatase [Deltaproteobacteria bacterium]MBW2535421.1 serine/threonine-protein phosphatase [Deltaproteobacteria bacterium]
MDTEKLSRAEVALDVAGLTHVGRVRQRNEDQYLVATLQRSLLVRDTSIKAEALRWLPAASDGTVLLVADGMGGAEDGDVASSVAVRAIGEYLCSLPQLADGPSASVRLRAGTLPGVREGLESALVEGDAEVRRAAAEADLSEEMGTTVTIAYLLWPLLYVAHAGDSRCYLYRGGLLRQLTTDHTLAQKFAEHSSLPIDEDSPWHHALWNVLGGGAADALQPEVRRVALEPEDVVLLCSDGLTKHVSDVEIGQVLAARPAAADGCGSLVAAANEGGGSDNVTVVIAQRRQGGRQVAPTPEGPTRIRGARGG